MDKKIFGEVCRMNKKYLKLLEWVGKLKDSGKLIIVEGVKDKRALEKMGIDNVITLKKALYKVVEEAAKHEKECIILTDFDKKGKQLYEKLNSGLSEEGVKIDRYFREWLRKHTRLSHIEGLMNYMEKL